jgi:hypothetical protein
MLNISHNGLLTIRGLEMLPALIALNLGTQITYRPLLVDPASLLWLRPHWRNGRNENMSSPFWHIFWQFSCFVGIISKATVMVMMMMMDAGDIIRVFFI